MNGKIWRNFKIPASHLYSSVLLVKGIDWEMKGRLHGGEVEDGIGSERWKGSYDVKWVGLHCRGKSKGCRAGATT